MYRAMLLISFSMAYIFKNLNCIKIMCLALDAFACDHDLEFCHKLSERTRALVGQ